MTLELVPLCQVDITLTDPILVGEGALGLRMILEVASGTVTGDRLHGSMMGHASADWVLMHGTIGALDVRVTFQTDDGAIILASYRGRTDLSPEGGGVIYVAPTFETGDERYAWLNTVQGAGKGTLDGTSLRYDWYELR